MMRHILSLGCSLALCSGCSVWSLPEANFSIPEVVLAQQWPQSAGEVNLAELPPPHWRDFVQEPKLRELITLALRNNSDIDIALANLHRVEALFRVQRAERLPNLAASASSSNQRLGEAITGAKSRVDRQQSLSVGIFSYEIDFWGRLAHLEQQALQTYLATEEAYFNTQLAIVSQVITSYLTLAANQSLLALAEETLASQSESLSLTQKSFDAGISTGLDLAQAEVPVAVAKLDVATFSQQIATELNALILLVGEQVNSDLLPSDDELILHPVTVGLPSTLLTNRPDIRAAERNLLASQGNIGAARAAFFPNISLTATAGLLSADLDELFSSGARSWNFTPSLTQPIFNWGSLQSSFNAAKAERDIALAEYEQTIETAFQEVADALVIRHSLKEQYAAQQQLVEAYRVSYEISELRFREGIDNFFSVLDSQRNYYQAEQALISLRLTQQSNLVALYRALGGGWSEPSTAPEQFEQKTIKQSIVEELTQEAEPSVATLAQHKAKE